MCIRDRLSKNYDINISNPCLNQQNIALGVLFKNSIEKDSVTFIRKEWVTVKNASGFVYFFKSLNSYNQEWQISYYGMFSDDETNFKVSEKLRGSKIKMRGYSEEEKLEELLNDFKLHKRKRADKRSKGGFNDYYLYD